MNQKKVQLLRIVYQPKKVEYFLFIFLKNEETQVNGVTLIYDVGDVVWNQLKYITPSFARRIVAVLQVISRDSSCLIMHTTTAIIDE